MFHPAVETRECQGDLSVAGKDQAGVIGFYSLMARWAQRLGFFAVSSTTLNILHKLLTKTRLPKQVSLLCRMVAVLMTIKKSVAASECLLIPSP